MGRVLYQGRSEHGVYPIYPSKAPNLSLPSRVCNHVASTSSLWELWHNRFGHPHAQVLHTLLPSIKISPNNCNSTSCTHCLSGNIHKLPFPTSHFIAHSPLELVHSDVWALLQFPLSINSSIMCYLLITILGLLGFIFFNISLRSFLCLLNSSQWLKHNFHQNLKP